MPYLPFLFVRHALETPATITVPPPEVQQIQREGFDNAPADVRRAIQQFWGDLDWETAALISMCETNRWTMFHNTFNEDSRGIFQINVAQGAHPEWAQYDLFDPVINAYFAHSLWLSAGGRWSRDWVN